MTATLTLPGVARLRDRATSYDGLRKKIAAFQHVTWVVENKWYELPYDVRREVVRLLELMDEKFPRPRTAKDWSDLVLILPRIFWSSITGEHILVQYAMAMAGLFAAIKLRTAYERDQSKNVWEALASGDSHFTEMIARSRQAPADAFISFDWTSPSSR
jgi:hypothetical protein